MKTCPQCERTYTDESLNFCLIDGAVLSASYDPHQTIKLPEPRTTDSQVDRPPPQSTIFAVQPSNPYAKPKPRLEAKRGVNHWLLIALGFTLVCLIGVVAIGTFLWTTSDRTAKNHDNSNVPKNTPTPLASPQASPTASVVADDGWEKHEETSINEGERIIFYPGTTIEKCQADCAENEKCIAYTYIKKGAYNPNDPPMCYLMSAIKTLNPSDCCFTGIRRQE